MANESIVNSKLSLTDLAAVRLLVCVRAVVEGQLRNTLSINYCAGIKHQGSISLVFAAEIIMDFLANLVLFVEAAGAFVTLELPLRVKVQVFNVIFFV